MRISEINRASNEWTWEKSLMEFTFPDLGVLYPPPSLRGKGTFLIPLSVVYPLPSGFPLIYPTENAFGGDPGRSPLKGEPTILGETFGATRLTLRVTIAGPLVRARLLPRTAPLRSRHVMPLAMRPLREESGALPAHYSFSATRLTLRVTIAGPSVRHSHGRRLLRLRS